MGQLSPGPTNGVSSPWSCSLKLTVRSDRALMGTCRDGVRRGGACPGLLFQFY